MTEKKCVVCKEPAAEGRTRCVRHLWDQREYQRRYQKKHSARINAKERERKARRKLDGLCPRCGRPRAYEGETPVYVDCADCSDKRHQRGY
jgi:hypothetical protein